MSNVISGDVVAREGRDAGDGDELTDTGLILSEPTDRHDDRAARGSERESTAMLFTRAVEAVRAGRTDEARALRAKARENGRHRRNEELAQHERRQSDLERAQAEAAQRGNTCDLTPQGCKCGGYLGWAHENFIAELRRPAISVETRDAVGALLGYTGGHKAQKIRAMFGGTRGNSPILPGFEWAAGALEEDWLELLELAERLPIGRGAPIRNPVDGSVREGWVRAVLPGIVGRNGKERRERAAQEAAVAEVTA